jgi:hypothetical protein
MLTALTTDTARHIGGVGVQEKHPGGDQLMYDTARPGWGTKNPR